MQNLLTTLGTSNSFWLGVINIVMNTIAVLTPLWAEYPRAMIYANVATGILFIGYKALSGTLKPPGTNGAKP